MLTIELNMYHAVALGAFLFWMGGIITDKVRLLNRYCIPAPLIGGLCFSVLNCILYSAGIASVTFDSTLQTVFMIMFFTTVGFTVSIPALLKGGKAVVLCLIVSVVMIPLQNFLGGGVMEVFGRDSLLGIGCGSIALIGGPGTAAAFGPDLEAAGAVGGSVVSIAAATFGLVAGSLMGGPTARRLIEKHNLRPEAMAAIGGTQGVEILEKLTQEIRVYWPGFEGFVTVYYEGIFSCYEEGNRGVSGINRALIDFYWKGGIIAPAFRRETLSMQNPLFEKCTIYDGGAPRYEIHEHIEEVLEFWNGILERADSIDKQALLEEKLGHPLPISYEDWLKDCHYEKLDKKTTRWLYQQERGFVEGMRDVSLKEISRQRIDEFTTTLRKYIL